MTVTMRTAKKYVTEVFENNGHVFPDRIVAKEKDNVLLITRGYFYRHGMSAERWGELVQGQVEGFGRVVETGDVWREFKGGSVGSEFEAYVEITDFDALKAAAAASRDNDPQVEVEAEPETVVEPEPEPEAEVAPVEWVTISEAAKACGRRYQQIRGKVVAEHFATQTDEETGKTLVSLQDVMEWHNTLTNK